jgi:hypothetical protein
MDKLAALAETAVADLYYARSEVSRPTAAAPEDSLRHAQLTESPEGQ